jgi:polysaccharide biosynthesis protein PslH
VKVLFVATRSPWPSVDGGRVLMAHTIDGLRARGHDVTVVAPDADGTAEPPPDPGVTARLVPVSRRWWPVSAVTALARRRPIAVEPHRHPAVTRAVSSCLRDGVDVVHVQQLHAFVHADAFAGRGLPIVLRAENVEADLWRQTSARAWWGAAGWPAAWSLRRWETEVLERVAVTAAVSDRDATALRHQAPLAAVEVVRIPMPATLPAGSRQLPGEPAVVLMAGAWWPNRDGASWFLRRVWPDVATVLPRARLHVFGLPGSAARGRGVEAHPRPAASADAFPAGAIAVVPARVASGANVRILEAWARGLPVVATPIAAGGVDPGDGAAIAMASTAAEFAVAFRRLADDAAARQRAVGAGRAALAAHHDPAALAARLEQVYVTAIRATAAEERR